MNHCTTPKIFSICEKLIVYADNIGLYVYSLMADNTEKTDNDGPGATATISQPRKYLLSTALHHC